MFAYFLSRHYLIVIVVCIFKQEEYLPYKCCGICTFFLFSKIRIKIVNIFIRYTCNVFPHVVKPDRTGSRRTQNIFNSGRFGSFWLPSLQLLLHYHLTFPVSPPQNILEWLAILTFFWYCKSSFRGNVTLRLFSFSSFLKEI